MDKLVIIHPIKGRIGEEKPFKGRDMLDAYEHWAELATKKGIKCYQASVDSYDVDKGTFSSTWTYEGNKWITVNDIKPDFVYDKSSGKINGDLIKIKRAITEKHVLLNDFKFQLFLSDKLNQYFIFGDYMPKTFLVHSQQELMNKIKLIKSENIVLKPLYGCGGYGIDIISRTETINNKKYKYPLLLQEFIKGVGFRKGVDRLSDLRMVFVNHELIYMCSRTASEGSLFTNYHQGAKMEVIKNSDAPKDIFVTAAEIQKKISIFEHCTYSLDFLFDKDMKPWFLEMNTMPGIDYFTADNRQYREKYINAVIEMFKGAKRK
ncbi:MAG: ATP-grasp domain-containing protein [Parcubacteria group bacterium]|nr:ATP-grasp domain-containing protein [Parcubacteria group bacterium]